MVTKKMSEKETFCFKCGKPLEGGATMCYWCARESELKATEEYEDNY
jgi:NMD protein affecting ribosome stability and mRNA decay